MYVMNDLKGLVKYLQKVNYTDFQLENALTSMGYSRVIKNMVSENQVMK